MDPVPQQQQPPQAPPAPASIQPMATPQAQPAGMPAPTTTPSAPAPGVVPAPAPAPAQAPAQPAAPPAQAPAQQQLPPVDGNTPLIYTDAGGNQVEKTVNDLISESNQLSSLGGAEQAELAVKVLAGDREAISKVLSLGEPEKPDVTHPQAGDPALMHPDMAERMNRFESTQKQYEDRMRQMDNQEQLAMIANSLSLDDIRKYVPLTAASPQGPTKVKNAMDYIKQQYDQKGIAPTAQQQQQDLVNAYMYVEQQEKQAYEHYRGLKAPAPQAQGQPGPGQQQQPQQPQRPETIHYNQVPQTPVMSGQIPDSGGGQTPMGTPPQQPTDEKYTTGDLAEKMKAQTRQAEGTV